MPFTARDEFMALVPGKVFGLLTEQEDGRLLQLTTTALNKLHAEA